ncbi:MAG: hypothetical protein PHQ91_10840 [Thermoanaerobaculaceae bacterium]|nr:hypothetical protein [Thermoanaerobaculaceae bacterium]
MSGCGWRGVLSFAVAVAGAAAAWSQTAPAPRFPGAATTVAVNRASGKVAVLVGGQLQLFDDVRAPSPSARLELPGSGPRVLEFCGPNLRYVTHGVQGMAQVFVAITADGRERLAWPNSGLSELFPSQDSRLTLDGKGLYGFLPLDPAAREYFGLPGDIPTGAGVAATFRFAGEKLLARASAAFAGVVALSPDDMLLTLDGGGLMRYRSPGGVAWKREGRGGAWRVVDVDPAGGVAAAVDGEGAVVGIGIERGEPRFRGALPGARVRDARLLSDSRLLVLQVAPERRAAILDTTTMRPAGEQPAELCARQGLAAVYESWLGTADSLAGLLDAGAAGHPALLLHGAAGWYLVTLRERPAAASTAEKP